MLPLTCKGFVSSCASAAPRQQTHPLSLDDLMPLNEPRMIIWRPKVTTSLSVSDTWTSSQSASSGRNRRSMLPTPSRASAGASGKSGDDLSDVAHLEVASDAFLCLLTSAPVILSPGMHGALRAQAAGATEHVSGCGKMATYFVEMSTRDAAAAT